LLPLRSRTSSSPGACARRPARSSRRGDFPRSGLRRSPSEGLDDSGAPGPGPRSRPLGARIANDNQARSFRATRRTSDSTARAPPPRSRFGSRIARMSARLLRQNSTAMRPHEASDRRIPTWKTAKNVRWVFASTPRATSATRKCRSRETGRSVARCAEGRSSRRSERPGRRLGVPERRSAHRREGEVLSPERRSHIREAFLRRNSTSIGFNRDRPRAEIARSPRRRVVDRRRPTPWKPFGEGSAGHHRARGGTKGCFAGEPAGRSAIGSIPTRCTRPRSRTA